MNERRQTESLFYNSIHKNSKNTQNSIRNFKKHQIRANICVYRAVCVGRQHKGLLYLNRSLPGTLRKLLVLTVSHPQTFRMRPLYFCFQNAEKINVEKHGLLIKLSQNRTFRIRVCLLSARVAAFSQVAFHKFYVCVFLKVGPLKHGSETVTLHLA